MTFDGFEGDIELPKLSNGEFFGHFDEPNGEHFLDVSGGGRKLHNVNCRNCESDINTTRATNTVMK